MAYRVLIDQLTDESYSGNTITAKENPPLRTEDERSGC